MIWVVAMFVVQLSWAAGSIEKGTCTRDVGAKAFDDDAGEFDEYSAESYELFEFVATQSETLKFYTNVGQGYDTYCALFDKDKRVIQICNDNMDAWNGNLNAILGYRVIEGDTYYFGVRDFYGEPIRGCEIRVATAPATYGRAVSQPETAKDLDAKWLKVGYNDRAISALDLEDNWNNQDRGNYVVFEFVPEVSGKFSFASVDYSHTEGALFDANGKAMVLGQYTNPQKSNYNFILSADVEAGKKYYLGVKDSSGKAISKCRIAIKACEEDYGTFVYGMTDERLSLGTNYRKIGSLPYDMSNQRYDASDVRNFCVYQFVANEWATFCFRSEGGYRAVAQLYDAKMVPVWMSEDDGSGNFRLSYSCEGGKTYYLGVRQLVGAGIDKLPIVVEKSSVDYGEPFFNALDKNITMGENKREVDMNYESYDSYYYEIYSLPEKYEMFCFVAPESERVSFVLEGDISAYMVLFDKDMKPVWKGSYLDGNEALTYDVVKDETYYLGIHKHGGWGKPIKIVVKPNENVVGTPAVDPANKQIAMGMNYREVAKSEYECDNWQIFPQVAEAYDLFEFVPEESGRVSFATADDDWYRMQVALFDANRTALWIGQYVSYSNHNAILSYKVEAGKKYYLGVRTAGGEMAECCSIVVSPCEEVYGDGAGILYEKEIAMGENVRTVPEKVSWGDYDSEADRYKLFEFEAPSYGRFLFYTKDHADIMLFDMNKSPLRRSTYLGKTSRGYALSSELEWGRTYYLGVAGVYEPIDSCHFVVEKSPEIIGRPYDNERVGELFTLGYKTADLTDKVSIRSFATKNYNISYNPDLGFVKLVLDNFEYEGSELQNGDFISAPLNTLIVELRGKNKITINDAKFFARVFDAGSVMFCGNGSLEINISDKVKDCTVIQGDMIGGMSPECLSLIDPDEEFDEEENEIIEALMQKEFKGSVTINTNATLYSEALSSESFTWGGGSLEINMSRADSLACAFDTYSYYMVDGKIAVRCEGENSLGLDADEIYMYDTDLEISAGMAFNDYRMDEFSANTRMPYFADYTVLVGKDKESAEEVAQSADLVEECMGCGYFHSYPTIKLHERALLYDRKNDDDFFDELAEMEVLDCIPMNVTVMREFGAGQLETLCLPFDVDDVSMFDVVAEYHQGSIGDGLEFVSTDHMRAGIPYLVLSRRGIMYPSFNNVMVRGSVKAKSITDKTYFNQIEMEGNKHTTFYGTFTPKVVEDDGWCYYSLSSNKLWGYVLPNTEILGLRGYFKAAAYDSFGSFMVDGYDSRAVSIDGVVIGGASDGAAYNLQGQRVKPDAKGIVIKNGKKYLNR